MLRLMAMFGALCATVSAQIVLNPAPTRVLGHPRPGISQINPNLVEGRELYQPQGVAVDTSVSPPILYIADTGNNRVLAWRSLGGGANGATADLVIGQRDLFSTSALGPGTTLSTGLSAPTGVAVDRQGNLWVADSGNNRILRYPRPFAQTSDLPFPDVVMGQTTLNGRTANAGNATPVDNGFSFAASGRTFRVSLTFDSAGNLWVTDPNNHRVLRFPPTAQARNGGAADLVLGQVDFVSRVTSSFSAASRANKSIMNTPSALTTEGSQRVYVSDGFGRVLVFAPPFTNGVAATRILGLSTTATPAEPINNTTIGITSSGTLLSAEGLFFVNNNLGVVDTAAHRILLFPPADTWAAESTATLSPPPPLSLARPHST
jgi:sugar lactone lactonase YvrE